MPYTPQQLSDMEDIKLLKHRYFRAVDTADWSLIQDAFAEDIHVEYIGASYEVKLDGRAAFLEFLANGFHSGAVAMHHGHHPEITFSDADTAEGLWYLEDIFINLEEKWHCYGTAIYRDTYKRSGGRWQLVHSTYERVVEVVEPLHEGAQYLAYRLGKTGRKPEERTDNSKYITWFR